jgi:hypothetical protein
MSQYSPEYVEGFKVGRAYKRGDKSKHSVTCPYRFVCGQAREWSEWRRGWAAGQKAKGVDVKRVLGR